MSWEAIGAGAELLAAVGVICSLLYLAAQIRTSNESAKAQMEQTRLNNFTELMLSTLDHTDLMRDGLAPGISTDLDAKRVIYFHAWFNSAQYTYNQVAKGSLGDSELERMYGRYINYWFRHYEPFLAWWSFSRSNFQDDFCEWVDEHDDRDA
ncbi:MAG: hypothetical protein MJA83_09195 [Gammaproteobacteria bacterium]|nr:hypothetical protein [Gammaproteobacteria bacterium]